MQHTSGRALVSALAILLAGTGLHAAEDPALDPGTIAALQKMGVYLRSLTTFQVEAVTTDEDVLDDGEKVQRSGVATILARRPSRLRAEVSNDRSKRLLLFDGSTLTVFAERLGYYATTPAPPTIEKLIDKLDSEYDLSLPFEDLFRWGAPGWTLTAVQHARDLGPAEIDGVTCEHYALRQDDLDWQIWLQRGDYPLPRKVVITTRSDEERPQHTAVYTWNLAPSFNEAAFKFDAPPDAKRVRLSSAAPAAPPAVH